MQLRNGIEIGKGSNTVLSVLLGANLPEQLSDTYAKLENIAQYESESVAIISDVGMYSAPMKETLWYRVLHHTPFAAATVPIYQVFKPGNIVDRVRLLELMEQQMDAGVSILTIHPTATVELAKKARKRIIPCTSRGGAMVLSSMYLEGKIDNLFIDMLDDIAKLAKQYRSTISIGTTFRSGTVLDACDDTYWCELTKQLEISQYLKNRGVSTIIETPGHADVAAIEKICRFLEATEENIMPLGPMPTDIAMKYDDVAACIGATLMGISNCADILAVVTREEHLGGIPSLDSLIEAIRKYRVAAHVINMKKTGDRASDLAVSLMRKQKKSCALDVIGDCTRCEYACPLRM